MTTTRSTKRKNGDAGRTNDEHEGHDGDDREIEDE
jgi:hypothetical protein